MARNKLGQPDDTPVLSDNDLSLSGGDWNEQMTTLLFAREARSLIVK